MKDNRIDPGFSSIFFIFGGMNYEGQQDGPWIFLYIFFGGGMNYEGQQDGPWIFLYIHLLWVSYGGRQDEPWIFLCLNSLSPVFH
jgi:hypothetical protein